jgi:Glu-tRNA(Gln) amidotransferase subunit E-like FAD-binding protein
MKLSDAQELYKVSSEALKLGELIIKATSISRWLTNKTKKGVASWRITIEPQGINYSYRNSIGITIPRDMGIKEIKALAKVIKAEAQRQLNDLSVDEVVKKR